MSDNKMFHGVFSVISISNSQDQVRPLEAPPVSHQRDPCHPDQTGPVPTAHTSTRAIERCAKSARTKSSKTEGGTSGPSKGLCLLHFDYCLK